MFDGEYLVPTVLGVGGLIKHTGNWTEYAHIDDEEHEDTCIGDKILPAKYARTERDEMTLKQLFNKG